jgi:hypothetical protein
MVVRQPHPRLYSSTLSDSLLNIEIIGTERERVEAERRSPTAPHAGLPSLVPRVPISIAALRAL